jgi:hypothetical protein
MPRVSLRVISLYTHTQILSVAISPVQNHIASGGDDGRLIVTDSVTGDVKFSCDAHKCWIRCVTYSPDGALIATGSDDSSISIWDADDGSCLLGPFDCGVGAVLAIAFSPDGKVVISGNARSRATFFGILRCRSREQRCYRPFLGSEHPNFRPPQSALNLSRSYWPGANSDVRAYGRFGENCLGFR